jgi:prevent-host-death family protein
MSTEKINTNKARKDFADNINRVAYGHERLTVTRHGKPVAAIISVEDLEFLEKLEHALDKKAIQEAWEEQGDEPLKSHDEVKSLLGLQ